jgi:hypothetical protein
MSELVAPARTSAPKSTATASTAARPPALTPARTARLQRACACGQVPGSGGKCDECEKKKKSPVMQRASSGGPQPASLPPSVNQVLGSSGRPLDDSTRSHMESRFGHDFSGVRIHDDSLAAESASAVNAKAYTVGQDIAFASGQYNPQTHAGGHLLAHELAHTIQQSGLQRFGEGINTEHDTEYRRMEAEADMAAAAVTRGDPIGLSHHASRPTLSRADEATIAPAKAQKPKQKTSSLGGSVVTHTVTPTEVATKTEGGTQVSLEEFAVDFFYMPAAKGPNALAIYQGMAGKSLETTVEIQGSGKTKTALWQTRPPTADLRDIWLQKVGWTGGDSNDLWERSGGDKIFPQVAGKTCQMDHIVELQIGGNNTPENMQPLDATQNQSSGGSIKGELQTLALNISNDKDLSSGNATQIKLRFQDAKIVGVPEKLPTACPPKVNRTCLGVESCAKSLKVTKTAEGKVSVARVQYPIAAGGRPPTNLQIPVTFGAAPNESVPIEGDVQNDPSSTLIPGLLLKTLAHRKGTTVKPDAILARIDDRDKTRLPITIDPNAKPFTLQAAADGNLTLSPADKGGGLGFTYKYLSPGKITKFGVDDTGEATWEGYITPRVPFLGKLGVVYSKKELLITKGLDEAELKKRSVLGMRITKAQLQVKLAPEFKPSGVIEMQLGQGDKPLAKASLTVEADSIGIVATGKLNVNIPKMETAESVITYRGGADRNEWDAKINIKSEDIKLGSSVTVTGGFEGTITKGGINFTGKVSAAFPGENTAELGLKKSGAEWILFGGGKFHFPKLDETKVTVTYFLGKGKLVATGETGFTIPAIGLSGKLSSVTFTITEGAPIVVTGTGSLDFAKGKAKGHVDVTLHPGGKFTGKGSLSYQLKENIIITGTVELDEKEKLHITGELLITRYEIFKSYGDTKDLFTLDVPVPVPGLSIGTTGLVFHIRAGVSVSYSFGPGTIEPLKFSAGFDPLETDPNLKLAVTGSVKIPASATISAFISGSLSVQLDAYVASAGAEGGVKLQGDLMLKAGAFADFTAAYENRKLSAKLEAGIDTKLLLGLSLTAFVRAWAGAFGFSGEVRKDWTLAKKTIDTGLGFYIKAPFAYADDTGVKLPELKDIELRKPQFTKENMERILGEIFSGVTPTTKES